MAAGHGGSPLLRTFGAVFRTALLTVLDALGVEHAAQDMITRPRQIFHAAAANHHHRVLLQIVPLTRYVADDLETIGQPHLGDLAQRRVRLLRCRRIYARANAALLRRSLQRRHSVARLEWVPRLGNQLVDCRHFACLRYSRLGARARNRSWLSACFLLARTVLADRFLGFSALYSHATFPRAKTKWRHPLGNAGAFFRSDDHKAVKHRGRSV